MAAIQDVGGEEVFPKAQMNPARPTRQEIESIIAAATRAPSGDNCQPWSLSWDGDILRAFHVEERGRHALNHRNHASYLTFGCLAESLLIAAKPHGWDTSLKWIFNIDRPDAPWFEVRFEARQAEQNDPLAQAMAIRYTDRRTFNSTPLPSAVSEQLRADAADFVDVSFWLIEQFPKSLLDYLVHADAFVWRHRAAQQDLMKWVRFNSQEVIGSRTGMPWKTMGMSFLESRIFKLGKSCRMQKVLNKLGFIWQSGHIARRLLESSSALFCFTVRNASPLALFETGRLALRQWLRLNAAGFGVQPYTVGSLFVYDCLTSALPEDTRPDFVGLFTTGRAILKEAFGFSDDDTPVWLFRTGIAGPPDEMTLRLETADVLRFKESPHRTK